MNLFVCTGNIGNQAEVRHTQGGTAIASFSLAVKSGYGDKEKTMWVRCALFGKRAEGKLPEYLVKGAQIAVSGELSLNEWTDKDGLTKTSLELNVDNLDLIGGKKSENTPAPTPSADYDDDLAF